MRRAGPSALACVALALLWPAAPGEAGRYDEPSRIAPLADDSLLLDAAVAGRRVVAVGQRGHVLISEDQGASWRQVVVPTRVTLTAVHFPTPRHGWAVGHDAVVIHTSDAGETWERQYADPDLQSPLLDVWFADEERGFAVGAYSQFLETRDGGRTWRSRTITERDVHHNTMTATPDGRLFVAGERGTVFRSTDGGDSWTELESPDPASLFGALGLPDGDLLVFGLLGRAHLWPGDEGGWRAVDTGTESSLMGGTVTADGRIVLGGLNGVVPVSGDGGDTFELRTRSDREAVAAAVDPPDGGVLLFGAFGTAELDSLVPTAEALRTEEGPL